MGAARFGKTVILANPASQSGAGKQAAQHVEAYLRGRADACDSLVLTYTERPGHAEQIAAGLDSCDTVIVVGGDGTVHETVNGLMCLPREQRPALALVPVGSGNDYARTLGMARKVDDACAQLLSATRVNAELGCCNGRYYAETLSFGLDAAIALDTVERRQQSGAAGLRLYAASCVDQLLHNKVLYDYRARVDEGPWEEGQMYLFAVQVGRTYGSGFAISPNARIDDGLLDVCIAHPPLSTAKAAWIFLRAKGGHHEHFSQIDVRRCTSLTLEFARELPVQIDGERLSATHYDIRIEPQALDVYVTR